ncbi:COG4705 family protein [Lacisediminihabitans sp. FW035]
MDSRLPLTRPSRLAPVTASKVPGITVVFWIVKVLTTGMGETTSDFLVRSIDPVAAVTIGGLVFAGALALQFAAGRYIPWVYWLAVAMVSVFGTMAADVTHIVLGVPYLVSTAAFAVALAAVFVVWFRTEGTLSIHSITTRRRESFYWAAVLVTFALGTATGDLTATTLHLGYFASGVLFAVVILIPALGYRIGAFGPVIAFWFAYVTTRPLGASFADWMGVSHARGGLQWGTGPVSLALAALIVAGVAGLTLRDRRR